MAIYFMGTVVMGVFGFINTMLLTRVLSERAYAMYGLLSNFATTIAMFLAFGYDAAYTRFYYIHDRPQKSFLVKTMTIPCGLFVLTAVLLAEPHQFVLSYIFGDRFSGGLLVALLAYILFSAAHRFTQLTARMEGRAFNYVLSNFVGRFGFLIIIFFIFLLWKEVGFNWVLWSALIGSVLATCINLSIFRKLGSKSNEKGTLVTHRDMLSYGVPVMLNNLLILVMPLIEKLIIRDKAGWHVLSIYTAAAVFQTVVMLLVNTIDNIWNPLVFKHCDNPRKLKPIMHSFGMMVSAIVVVGFALCVLLRRWLVLVLDQSYYEVYIIAPAICFSTCFRLVSMIYSAGINISKKTIHFVIEPIVQIVFSLALCFLLLKDYGLIGVGVAVTASVLISRLYRMVVGLRLYDSGVSECKMWILMGLCTIVAFASLFFTSFIADLVMFAVLIAAMLLILNKDLLNVVEVTKTLLLPKKSVKNEVQG